MFCFVLLCFVLFCFFGGGVQKVFGNTATIRGVLDTPVPLPNVLTQLACGLLVSIARLIAVRLRTLGCDSVKSHAHSHHARNAWAVEPGNKL